MAAWEPDRVMVPVPLPLKVTPPFSGPRVSTPSRTLRVVVRLSPSMSPTATLLPLIRLNVLLPSSARVWAPGTAFTGASLTGLISNLRVAVSVSEPSLRV
ncbi:hypothetical protein D9M70_571850 [compost metagenome]